MTDETKELMEKARALLSAATPGRAEVVVDGDHHHVRIADGLARFCRIAVADNPDDADLFAFAVNNLPALLDALAAEKQRADEAESGAAAVRHLAREAHEVLRSLGGLHGLACPAYDDDDGGECDCWLSNVVGPLRSAIGGAWDRAFLARLHAAEADAAALPAMDAECARLRAQADADRQTIVRLTDELAERDALRAEVERLEARTAVTCKCASVVMGYTPGYVVVQSFCDYSVAAMVDCPACNGSGAVIVEGAT